uniref:Uncharacterized protein n=1 Tax=Heterosigma akashiwo TaxID=2829 RepID=A0A6V1NDR9_HETAK|mmetsp:Transcript_46093/g.76280  ORF Transcript_46093/g.76280 Transcript_46093/m.76280 type:complete len:1028 (+) Transcript_46093:289-3372(+)
MGRWYGALSCSMTYNCPWFSIPYTLMDRSLVVRRLCRHFITGAERFLDYQAQMDHRENVVKPLLVRKANRLAKEKELTDEEKTKRLMTYADVLHKEMLKFASNKVVDEVTGRRKPGTGTHLMSYPPFGFAQKSGTCALHHVCNDAKRVAQDLVDTAARQSMEAGHPYFLPGGQGKDVRQRRAKGAAIVTSGATPDVTQAPRDSSLSCIRGCLLKASPKLARELTGPFIPQTAAEKASCQAGHGAVSEDDDEQAGDGSGQPIDRPAASVGGGEDDVDIQPLEGTEAAENTMRVFSALHQVTQRLMRTYQGAQSVDLAEGPEDVMEAKGASSKDDKGDQPSARKQTFRMIGRDSKIFLKNGPAMASYLVAGFKGVRKLVADAWARATPAGEDDAPPTSSDGQAAAAAPPSRGEVGPLDPPGNATPPEAGAFPTDAPAGEGGPAEGLTEEGKVDTSEAAVMRAAVIAATRIHLLRCLEVHTSTYCCSFNFDEHCLQFIGLLYLALHEDFSLPFKTSSFFLAVVAPALLFLLRTSFIFVSGLYYAGLGILGKLEGGEHNNKLVKKRRWGWTNHQPGAGAQLLDSTVETYLGGNLLRELVGEWKPTVPLEDRNDHVRRATFGPEVPEAQYYLQCRVCRTLKDDLHPVFQQFAPLLDQVANALPEENVQRLLGELEKCRGSRTWNPDAPRPAQQHLEPRERLKHEVNTYMDYHGTTGYPLSSHVKAKDNSIGLPGWSEPPTRPLSVHRVFNMKVDYRPIRPPNDDEPEPTASDGEAAAASIPDAAAGDPEERPIQPPDDDVAERTSSDGSAAAAAPSSTPEVGAYLPLPEDVVEDPEYLQLRANMVCQLAKLQCPEKGEWWYLGTTLVKEQTPEGEVVVKERTGFLRDFRRGTAAATWSKDPRPDEWFAAELVGEPPPEAQRFGPQMLSKNPFVPDQEFVNRLPFLSEAFSSHLALDFNPEQPVCGLCGHVFLLLFTSMLGREAQDCVPYLTGYFKTIHRGGCSSQAPLPPPIPPARAFMKIIISNLVYFPCC